MLTPVVSPCHSPQVNKMSTLRPFRCADLFKFNQINFDPLTETYGLPFYLNYLAVWPEYFKVYESPSGKLMGYIMGKSEARFVLCMLCAMYWERVKRGLYCVCFVLCIVKE